MANEEEFEDTPRDRYERMSKVKRLSMLMVVLGLNLLLAGWVLPR